MNYSMSRLLVYSSSQKEPFLQILYKINVLKNVAQFIGKHLFWSLILIKLQACKFIEKETPGQVFSYEFHEMFKKT